MVYKKLLLAFAVLVLMALSVALAFYQVMICTNLPSDEEMIADFRAHRAEIEELVRKYRTYERPKSPAPDESRAEWLKQLPPNAFNWEKQYADIPELKQKAKVSRIDHSGHTPWLPNPYSIESAQNLHDMTGPSTRDFNLFYKYGAIRVKFSPVNKYYAGSLRYISVWKDFFFFPEIPRIEDGWIISPAQKNRPPSRYSRVLPSLDRFPYPWKIFECVYRQVEPHWFLRMCNGN
jgi:hypothetical protein